MILIRFVLYTLVLWGIIWVIPDIAIDTWWPTLVIAGAVFTIIQEIIKPVLKIITAPLTLITLGLFAFVLNAVIFWYVGQWVPGFVVGSYLAAFLGSILFSIGSWLVRRSTK